MAREMTVKEGARRPGALARDRLLAGIPAKERRLDLAGVSSAVLEGGRGEPVILLHGPGEHALKWSRVIPGLVETHHVIAPDLPGHGASEVTGGPLTRDRVLAWLDALIERTCASPPALVGQVVGGAMAVLYAADHGARVRRLVLVDTLGLAPFQPAPQFAQGLTAYVAGPSEATFEGHWRQCAFDFDRLRDEMGERWENFSAYTLDRALAPETRGAVDVLMEQFGLLPIPPEDLARLRVPTTLIWGQHDLATSLTVAEGASARYGWPLHVIEDAGGDPAAEQPERFLEALRLALG